VPQEFLKLKGSPRDVNKGDAVITFRYDQNFEFIDAIRSNRQCSPSFYDGALAQGVIGGSLEWKMIGIGALVGVGLIILDAVLGVMKKLRIPPLAVGIGIYLPMSATFAVIVGALISHWYDRRVRTMPNPERAERLGTLVASGLIVGESIWGVINAGLIVALSKDAPIGIVPEAFAPAPWLGVIGFVGAVVWLYGWMLRRSAAVSVR